MHITLKLAKGLGGLRSIGGILSFSRIAERARDLGLRIIHFSLQSNHLHMIVEADDNKRLETGMRSITTSLARMIQKWCDRAREVFAGRYDMRRLDSPREVKYAVRYVLFNHDHHCKSGETIDEYSSNVVNSNAKPAWLPEIKRAITEPRSWLLRTHLPSGTRI